MKNLKKRYLVPALIMFLLAGMLLGMNVYYGGQTVMCYMYHSVREEPVNPDNAELSVRPEVFEQQLKYFSESRFKTLFASELVNPRSKHSRYVVITFDDGYEDNYTEVFPLLKKYNCKATIFMITSLIGEEGYLNAAQIREMTDSGLVSIQSHTVSHDPLALGNKLFEEVDEEFRASKAVLERITQKEVDAVSMPNGSFDGIVLDLAKRYYNVVFSDISFRAYSDEDITDVHRIGIYRRHSAQDIEQMTDMRGFYYVKRTLQKIFPLI